MFEQNFILRLLKLGIAPFYDLGSKIDHNKESPFLMFNHVRFTIEDSIIIEYNIDFYNSDDLVFNICVEGLELNKISNKTLLHEFILFLKLARINFKEHKIKDDYYYMLITESKVYVVFDLLDGTLFRMGKFIFN